MADILSNEELDTLLSAVDDGDVAVGVGEVRRREKRISSYDFKKPNRFSRDQLRVLQYMHKGAAQLMSSSLSSALRIGVEVQLVSIGQLTYEGVMTSLADPICINIISMKPLEQMGVLSVDLPLAFAIMERMLGGAGEIPETVRPMTMLEETIVAQAILLMLSDIQESWKEIIELDMKVERREMNPGFVHVVPGPEIVLLITFSMGGQLPSGEIKLCIPYVSLEPIIGKLGSEHMAYRSTASGPSDRRYLERHLSATPVDLIAVLGGTRLTIGELLSLQVGHVLRLDTRADLPVACAVDGQDKYLARPGLAGRKTAVGIEEVLSHHEDAADPEPAEPEADTDAS